jgi:hypothetical protein
MYIRNKQVRIVDERVSPRFIKIVITLYPTIMGDDKYGTGSSFKGKLEAFY